MKSRWENKYVKADIFSSRFPFIKLLDTENKMQLLHLYLFIYIFISLSGHVSLTVATERNLFLETGSYMYI